MCDEVAPHTWDGELTVVERFFDGLLGAVCSSVVSDLSPVSGQPLDITGIGGAEGRPAATNKISYLDRRHVRMCVPSV